MNTLFRIAGPFMGAVLFTTGHFVIAAETLGPWELRLPFPTDSGLHDIAYGQGRFVAIAPSAVVVSTDGYTWQSSSLDGTNDFRTVTYGNGRFAAMGVAYPATGVGTGWSPCIAFSTNGLEWNTHAIKDFQIAPVGLAYGGGIYAMVGHNGICISSNGLSWTNVYSNPSAGLWDITYGNGRFVAVGESRMVSTNGQIWTSSLADTNPTMYAVTFGNGQFVATAVSQQVFLSTDGSAWVPSSLSTNDGNLSDICFGEGRFIIVGFSTYPGAAGAFILNSTNGSSWARSTIPSTSGLLAVAFGAGTFVGVAPGVVLTSQDGETWTGSESYRVQGIAFGNGMFVAPAFDQVLTSTDGLQWAPHPLTLPFKLGDAAFVGNRFFALNTLESYRPAATNGLATSVDGINWTSCMLWTNGTSETHVSLPAYGRNRFVAVGAEYNWATKEYTAHSFVSEDGLQWHAHAITSYLLEVTFANDRFVAIGLIGDNAAVFTSLDALSWEPTWTGSSDQVWSQIAFGNGTFVAANMGGFLVSYPDGTWRTVRPDNGFSGHVYDVAFGDGLFVASGAGGTVFISEDGYNWNPHNIGTSEWLWHITYAQGTFAVASGMSIHQSARTPLADFRLGSPRLLPSGAVQIPFGGVREKSWEIQASTDLCDWRLLATGTGTNAATGVIDTNAAPIPHRYYRALIRR